MEQLDSDRIQICHDKFVEIAQTVQREGASDFLNWLENTDFYLAPASPKLYRCYPAGLCEQALVRYDILCRLNKMLPTPYESDSIKITGLFGDTNKIDYYESYSVNRKEYSEKGQKQDDVGKFDWVAVTSYRIKESEDRFLFGTAGQNAERLITNYLPLRDEESIAIINKSVPFDNPTFYYGEIYKKYPLAALLHTADELATYVVTKDIAIEESIPF